MKTIDVYERYYAAECVYNGRERHAAVVKLTAESDAGNITYSVTVSFFPHDTEDDYQISYDAERTAILYTGKGRRSARRDEAYLAVLKETADQLAKELEGTIDWEKPLIEERRG